MKHVTVFGLGLIGGSVALGLRARGVTVAAVDRPEVLDFEVARAAADERIDTQDEERVREVLGRTDLVVLAVPVGVVAALLPHVLRCASTVTDCGSTKRVVMEAASRLSGAARFVGGHPMAGLPQSGLLTARPELFQDRSWIVCAGQANQDRVARVERFARLLGAVPIRMTPEQHDRAVALTSHVPQVLASLLTVLAARGDMARAAGPAFERATRTAGGAESMWRDVFVTNADEVARTLRTVSTELNQIAAALEADPADLGALLALLAEARRTHR
jgi:prephenate dehydrogenase